MGLYTRNFKLRSSQLQCRGAGALPSKREVVSHATYVHVPRVPRPRSASTFRVHVPRPRSASTFRVHVPRLHPAGWAPPRFSRSSDLCISVASARLCCLSLGVHGSSPHFPRVSQLGCPWRPSCRARAASHHGRGASTETVPPEDSFPSSPPALPRYSSSTETLVLPQLCCLGGSPHFFPRVSQLG